MSTQAGWYKDPHNSNLLRYWNGYNWTEHTSPVFNPPTPPLPPQQQYPQPVAQPRHSHPEYQSENSSSNQSYYSYHGVQGSNPTLDTSTSSTSPGPYFYPTVKKNSTATIVLSVLVGILTILIITVTSIASLMLLTPDNKTASPPAQTGEEYNQNPSEEFPPVNFDEGVRVPAEGAASWSVPEYWETISTANGATNYKTRTCEVKIFNTPITGEIPADVTSDEMLAALLLQETTKVSAATILADANSFHMHYKNTEDSVILLAAPWELNLEQVVDGVSTVKTIYGWDTVQASVMNKNAFGVQAGCENTTDLEAVMNELHSEGNVIF